MKHQKIVLSAGCLALLLLASCGNSTAVQTKTQTTETAAAVSAETETAEAVAPDPVEDIDFGGAEFHIMCSQSTIIHYQTTVNEQDGDVLNDALYARTSALEEKFNIVFADDQVCASSDDATSLLKKTVSAGDDAYQLAYILERGAFSLTGGGYFLDIAELPHVNLENAWWEGAVNSVINLTDHTYLAYGSADLGLYDVMHALLFNKQMAADLDLEDIYQLVLDGKWTIDKMAEMGKAAIRDADGDGAWGTGDIYAFTGAPNTTVVDFLAASKIRTVEVDADKNVTINLLTDPAIEEMYTKLYDIFFTDGFWYTGSFNSSNFNSNNYYQTDTFFQDNQALFADHTMFTISYLRDMITDFGIVPFPKADESMDGYGTMVEAGSRVMTVPATVTNTEMVGAVLEMMNYLSLYDVRPAYYEVTLKQKYTRDSVSAQMLDIITAGNFYDMGSTMFNDYVKDGIFFTLFKSKNRDYVSTATKKITALEKAIEKAKNG